MAELQSHPVEHAHVDPALAKAKTGDDTKAVKTELPKSSPKPAHKTADKTKRK
jgi:hypothetical protein